MMGRGVDGGWRAGGFSWSTGAGGLNGTHAGAGTRAEADWRASAPGVAPPALFASNASGVRMRRGLASGYRSWRSIWIVAARGVFRPSTVSDACAVRDAARASAPAPPRRRAAAGHRHARVPRRRALPRSSRRAGRLRGAAPDIADADGAGDVLPRRRLPVARSPSLPRRVALRARLGGDRCAQGAQAVAERDAGHLTAATRSSATSEDGCVRPVASTRCVRRLLQRIDLRRRHRAVRLRGFTFIREKGAHG